MHGTQICSIRKAVNYMKLINIGEVEDNLKWWMTPNDKKCKQREKAYEFAATEAIFHKLVPLRSTEIALNRFT